MAGLGRQPGCSGLKRLGAERLFIEDLPASTHLLFPARRSPQHSITPFSHFLASLRLLVAENPPAPNPKSLGVMLLSDIREIFSESGVTKITLKQLVECLCSLSLGHGSKFTADVE